MRKLWATGVAAVMCLALAGVPVVAQAPKATGIQMTVTQECSGGSPCTWTASDPRLPATLDTEMFTGSVAVEGAGFLDAGFAWLDVGSEGPEGGWTGYVYALWGEPTQNFLVLSGTGANEGWHYVASGVDPEPDGDFEWTGTLYEGELPPFPHPVELPTPAEAATAAETIGEPADSGARIIEVEELDERTVDLTIDSPVVGTQKVRLLLPAGFEPEADADWPVLYLLHGGGNSYLNWTLETDVEELTAELPLLVVMPEAGWDGWYADWWNGGTGGPPMWETFHLTELRELLERNWQAGDERVVAGYSMGGLGAMSYAARHPGLFRAAAAFTGVLHPTALDPSIVGFDVPPGVWGDRTEQADVWEAHDPVEMAPALEGTALYVSYGDGQPGPLDAGDAAFDELEAGLAAMNEAFVARLEELGIPVTVDAYGPGTHTMPYVERGLHKAMPLLLEALGT